MNIIALVKQTPDTAKLSRTVNGMQLMADGGPRIVNPWDEYALETALQLKEKHGAKKVIALSVGRPEAVEALRTALAMGVDEAVLVSDPVLAGADTLGTAQALAAAIRKIGGYDIVVAGRNSIDGGAGATAVQVAALLDAPVVSNVSALRSVNAAGRSIALARSVDGGRETVTTRLPCVISVVKDIAEPRYPSFMGIRKAAKAPIPTWTAADIGVAGPASRVTWTVELPAARETSVEMLKGTPQEQAKALLDRLAEQKVI